MTYEMTTTTTLYSLSELKEFSESGYMNALLLLEDMASETWYEFDWPYLLEAFQNENAQPGLSALYDPQTRQIEPSGRLTVPAEISQKWIDQDCPDWESVRVQVMRFYSGWQSLIGAGDYFWIEDEDGECLMALLDELMERLEQRSYESYQDAIASESLASLADEQRMLFDLRGEYITTVDAL